MKPIPSVTGSTVFALASGLFTFKLWRALGMPDGGAPLDAPFPGLWRWVFAVWMPLLFPAFTAIHGWLVRATPPGAARAVVAAVRWNRWTHVALAVFPAWLVAWHGATGWRLALGGFFVTVLFGKTLLLVVALYRVAFGRTDPDDDGQALPQAALFLGATALLLYAGLVPYVITAVSTAGDEPLYLMSTHSLLVDRDFNLANNTRQGDFKGFYWGRGRPWGEGQGGFLALPVLLLPGYGAARVLLPAYPLAGRLGATLLIALCTALAGVVAYRLCRDLGCSRPASFWAWVTLALTPPFVVASGHIYPEVPALLLGLLGVRAILRIPGQRRAGIVVLGAAVALALLKERFLSLALGLPAWAGIRLARRSRGAALALLAILTGAVVLAVRTPHLFPYLASLRLRGVLGWNRYMLVAALGMVADQEYGLLFYAPAWILAVFGIPGLWRRDREATLGLLGLVGGYALVVIKYRWMQWDAGWTPPPRFILPAIPLLVPFLAEGFDRLRGRSGFAAVHTLWLIWSAAITWCLALVPFWRYNTLSGRSTLLAQAGTTLGLDLARFLPSLRAPTLWTWMVLGAAGLGLIVLAACAAVRGRPGMQSPDASWGVGTMLLRPLPAVGLVLAVALVWLAAAAVIPTWSIEAEAMHHSAGIQYGAYQWDDILWVMPRDGELSERIVTWPGLTRITVIAGGLSTTGIAPRMTLLLNDEVVREWVLQFGSVPSWEARTFDLQGWDVRKYVATVQTRFGRPTLRIRISETLDQRGAGRVQHAYVDRIVLEWSPGRDRLE